MPTLQQMHKIVAQHPMIQAEFFMRMDALVHSELLCIRNAFLGKRVLFDRSVHWPDIEDDYASTGEPGIANFPRSALKPLEAQ